MIPTYTADTLRREIAVLWPERHRRRYIRCHIRFNVHTIRRMEAA